MRTTAVYSFLLISLAVVSRESAAQPFPQRDLPPQLQPWVKWVLDDVPDHVCPARDGAAICLWPGRITLDLMDEGGRFDLTAYADRALDLPLPGDAERWPLDVRLDGQAVPVVNRNEAPVLRLGVGSHRISGRFEWKRLPDSLALPKEIGLVALRVRGVPIDLPQREENGPIWLRRAGDERGASTESMQIQVYRKVVDGLPVFVDTSIALDVSGKAREIELSGAVLEHAVPIATSGDLPAQLDARGRLRVQVRAGKFHVSLLTRIDGRGEKLTAPKSKAPWPERETWVFAANDRLRQVQVSGGTPIDSSRTEMPVEWRPLPAFVLGGGDQLTLKEMQRGEVEAAPDRLTLSRSLWLDLNGRGFTVRDTFSGNLNRTWRLEMLAPGELGRVSVDGQDTLVTAMDEKGPSGVELRKSAVALVADSRLTRQGALPAVGWDANVQSLSATLHMPPGWRVFSALGVDKLPGSWMSRWTLLGFFFVLLVAISVARLFGRTTGLLALFAVGLAYHETGAPFLIWLSLIAAAAVLRALPEGRVKTAVRLWWWFSVATLALILISFFSQQIRAALYPQTVFQGEAGFFLAKDAVVPSRHVAPAAPPPAVPAEHQQMSAGEVQQMKSLGYLDESVADKAVIPSQSPAPYEKVAEYARMSRRKADKGWLASNLAQDPRSVLQTGPGIPNWTWRSFNLAWSGPVSRDQRLRLFLLSPLDNLLLTIVRMALILVLSARLLGLSLQSFRFLRRGMTAGLVALLLFASSAKAEEGQESEERLSPNARLLEELKARLTRAEPCAPICVTTASLTLSADSEQLVLSAEVHAAAKTSWAIPGPTSVFVPSGVTLDGQPALALARRDDGFLHLRIGAGVHRVVARGALPRVDSLTLQLKDRPHHAEAHSDAWEIAGIRADGRPDASIQLSRRLRSGQRAAAGGSHHSAWLEIDRTLEIGVAWRVVTVVRRVSPIGVPVAVRVPLLAGEALYEGGWDVDKGEVAISLSRDDSEARWASTLPIQETLVLAAPEGRPWSEVWRLQCGVVWQCAAEGLPPTARLRDGQYEPEYRPWPGEKLSLRFARPQGVKGQTVTIESVRLAVDPGERLEMTTLTLHTRASREEALSLGLPPRVELQEIKIGENARPIRPDGDRLTLNLPPGPQTVTIRWHLGRGIRPFYAAPRVTLPVKATNVLTEAKLPEGRWLLFVWGPAWGPAIMFWSYLLFVIVVALVLARVPTSPLTTGQWLLLGLGLTQIPVVAAAVVVVLFFALAWRMRHPLASPSLFGLFQLALVFWIIVALGCLYAAIHTGLLLKPDMQVAGNGSSDTLLRFYADQVQGLTPAIRVVSLPLWIYRLVMLLWSLWLAASLVRWSRWAWQCLSEGGLWRAQGLKGPMSDPITSTRTSRGSEPSIPKL